MKSNLTIALMIAFLAACNPTVKVEAPEKPIEINLNVKIEHNIQKVINKPSQRFLRPCRLEMMESQGGQWMSVSDQ